MGQWGLNLTAVAVSSVNIHCSLGTQHIRMLCVFHGEYQDSRTTLGDAFAKVRARGMHPFLPNWQR